MSKPIPDNLIGNSPEVKVTVDKIECIALADTGSQVTTMSNTFFTEQFPTTELHSLQSLVRIESVSGSSLPYNGYFVAQIKIPLSAKKCIDQQIPIMIVPDTTYNSKVPLLLGTNILLDLLSFPDLELKPALRIARQALQLTSRHLEKTQGVFSNVYAMSDISVPAKSGVLTCGHTTIVIPIQQQIALIQESTSNISVLPAIVQVKSGSAEVPVEIINDTNEDILVQRGKKIAELHQATLEPTNGEVNSDFLDSFDYSGLTDSDTIVLKQFL